MTDTEAAEKLLCLLVKKQPIRKKLSLEGEWKRGEEEQKIHL